MTEAAAAGFSLVQRFIPRDGVLTLSAAWLASCLGDTVCDVIRRPSIDTTLTVDEGLNISRANYTVALDLQLWNLSLFVNLTLVLRLTLFGFVLVFLVLHFSNRNSVRHG